MLKAPSERCIRAMRAQLARREHAAATLVRCKSVMDAVRPLWERRVDTEWTLY